MAQTLSTKKLSATTSTEGTAALFWSGSYGFGMSAVSSIPAVGLVYLRRRAQPERTRQGNNH